jgi:hypothetical protein
MRELDGMACGCKFATDEEGESDPWHFERKCEHCGGTWWGLHCPHDSYQNPCPDCGERPTVLIMPSGFFLRRDENQSSRDE